MVLCISGGGTGGHLAIVRAIASACKELNEGGLASTLNTTSHLSANFDETTSHPSTTPHSTANFDSIASHPTATFDETTTDKTAPSSKITPPTKEIEPITCIYIGSMRGQDRAWFENSPLFRATYFLDSEGVVNHRGLGLLRPLYKQYKGLFSAKAILLREGVDALVSVGGYSSGPASLAAIALGLPLYIHEQNATSGRLNRLLSPFAKRVFLSFYDPLHDVKDKYRLIRYPVPDAISEHYRVRKEIKTIAFVGGSQGAKALNNLALKIAPKLIERGYDIIHQCGERDYSRVHEAYKDMGLNTSVDLFAFRPELYRTLDNASICIARAGASSVFELASLGLPCIYVPYPHAASNHQYYNAMHFVQQGLGYMALEDEFLSEKALHYIDAYDAMVEDTRRVEVVSRGLAKYSRKDGSHEVIREIFDEVSARRR